MVELVSGHLLRSAAMRLPCGFSEAFLKELPAYRQLIISSNQHLVNSIELNVSTDRPPASALMQFQEEFSGIIRLCLLSHLLFAATSV